MMRRENLDMDFPGAKWPKRDNPSDHAVFGIGSRTDQETDVERFDG